MTKKAVFEGLIFDENDKAVSVVYVGSDPSYVVDDDGFHRHIPAEEVDREVLKGLLQQVEGHEGIISEQAAKMLGQDDIFTRAMVANQLKHIDEKIDMIFETGIPEGARSYLGMMGFKVIINHHGEVMKVVQPGIDPGGEGE